MPKPSVRDAERPFSDDDLKTLFAPLEGASHVALAVSGGSDSSAMMLLARRWQTAQAQPPQFSVLTVDHGLRSEAAAEADAVAQSAARLEFAHATLVWKGEKPATGIQAAARDARYRLMTDWCRAHEADWLLTAHTQDDQAETVLMRLARGTGIDGLVGIWRRREVDGVHIVRPLLGETRARLSALLIAEGVSWIDDPSNSIEKSERVRIRAAEPQLAALGLTPSALAKTADRALQAYHALWAYADDFLKVCSIRHSEGYAEVELESYLGLPEDTKRRVMTLLVNRYGGARNEPVSLAGAERIVHAELWQRRTFGGCRLARRQRTILVGREFGRIDAVPLIVPSTGKILWDGRFTISAPAGNQIVPLGVVPGIPRERRLPAFVQDALPAVQCTDGHVAVPHLRPELGVTAAFAPNGAD